MRDFQLDSNAFPQHGYQALLHMESIMKLPAIL